MLSAIMETKYYKGAFYVLALRKVLMQQNRDMVSAKIQIVATVKK
jgi:hypothetical protein